MSRNIPLHRICSALGQQPQAAAALRGSGAHAAISGCVCFYQMSGGVLVTARVTGLPESPTGIFGFHIHSGVRCSGTEEDPFADTLTHYNPQGVSHPHHAGDLPSLFGNHGYAFQAVFTDRFSVREILNKTVVIHAGPDDFISQPAGNAGEKIACGQIRACSG